MSLLVFDMDGVLVDVADSYRAAIAETVRYFTGQRASRIRIQQYKDAGGYNNDWELARALIFEIALRKIALKNVITVFQQYLLGNDNDGFILNEQWIPTQGLLDRLASKHQLAIFTGRPRTEALFTLTRFAPHVPWIKIVADGEVANAKPAPEGLMAIADGYRSDSVIYFGDTIDDAHSARATGVRFIGVGPSGKLLRAEGAQSVIANINSCEKVL